MNHLEVAYKLDELQKTKNSGRGISCIRQIVEYMLRDDFESAQNTAEWDQDKIRSYPDIDKFCIENGLITC